MDGFFARMRCSGRKTLRQVGQQGADGLRLAPHRPTGTPEQATLQGPPVFVQRIRGAVQATQVHLLKIVANEFTQARGVLQPGVRGQLAARLGYACDDIAHGRSDLLAVQAQL